MSLTKKGGRYTAESRAMAKIAETEVIKYPEPPYDLQERERDVWYDVVKDCTPDWFSPRNLVLLKQYCRHCISADNIAELLADAMRALRREPTLMDLGELTYIDLLRMQAMEGRMIAMLAVKMRIAHQSTIDTISAHKRVNHKEKKPLWEI